MCSPGRPVSRLACVVFLLYAAACVSGCSAARPPAPASRLSADLMDAYLLKVVKFDGIDQEEALILAQSQMFFQGRARDFDVDNPRWLPDDTCWVLSFKSVRRTLADVLADKAIVIMVDKQNGAVTVEE